MMSIQTIKSPGLLHRASVAMATTESVAIGSAVIGLGSLAYAASAMLRGDNEAAAHGVELASLSATIGVSAMALKVLRRHREHRALENRRLKEIVPEGQDR